MKNGEEIAAYQKKWVKVDIRRCSRYVDGLVLEKVREISRPPEDYLRSVGVLMRRKPRYVNCIKEKVYNKCK